jgi:hypothetical protein
VAITDKNGNVSYEDRVLKVSSRYNSSMDIDEYYADVWDGEQVRHICYGSNFGESGKAEVDAIPEVIAEYRTWLYQIRLEILAENSWRKASEIFLGMVATVIKGRKLPIGTTGIIFWKGPNKFAYGRYSVGLELADGSRVFTDENNIRIDPFDYMPSWEELEAEARQYAYGVKY